MGQTLGQRIPRQDRLVLAAVVRELRREAELSQEELAALVGTSQNAISNLEIGERRLDVLELRRLCSALGVSVETFITRLEAALSA